MEEFLKSVISASDNRVTVANLALASLLTNNRTSDIRRFAATVVTTNFDLQLQKSLQICQQLYAISDTPASIQELDVHSFGWTHLIHAHGSAFRYRMANSEQEIREWTAALGGLSGVYNSDEVLVLGYGGWDDGVFQSLKNLPESVRITWVDRFPIAACDLVLSNNVMGLLTKRPNTYYCCADLSTFLLRVHNGIGLDWLPISISDPLAMAKNTMEMIHMPRNPSTLTQAHEARVGHAYGSTPEARAFRREAERVHTYASRLAAWVKTAGPTHLNAGTERILPTLFSMPCFLIERLILAGDYVTAEKEALRTYGDLSQEVQERFDAAHKAARLLARRGELEQAVLLFKAIADKDSVSMELRATAYANYLHASLAEPSEALLAEVDTWLQKADYSGAEALLLKCKVRIEHRLKRFPEAVTTAMRICALPEDDAAASSEVLSMLGRELLIEKQPVRGSMLLRESIRLGSSFGITHAQDVVLIALTEAATGRLGIAIKRLITLLATAHPEDREAVSKALSSITFLGAISTEDADHILALARAYCDRSLLELVEILCTSVYFANGEQGKAVPLLAVVESREIKQTNCFSYLLTAIRVHHKEGNYSKCRSLLPRLLQIGKRVGPLVDLVIPAMMESLGELHDSKARLVLSRFIVSRRAENLEFCWRAYESISDILYDSKDYLGAARSAIRGVRCPATPESVRGVLLLRVAASVLQIGHPRLALWMHERGHRLIKSESLEFYDSLLLRAELGDALAEPKIVFSAIQSVLNGAKPSKEQRIKAHQMLIGYYLAVGDYGTGRASARILHEYGVDKKSIDHLLAVIDEIERKRTAPGVDSL